MSIAPNRNHYPRAESHIPRIGGLVTELPSLTNGTDLGDLARRAWQQAQEDERQRRRREAEAIRTRQAADLVEACRRILQVNPTPQQVRFDGDGRALVCLDGYILKGGHTSDGYWLAVVDAFDCWHHVVDLADFGRLCEERELTRVVRR